MADQDPRIVELVSCRNGRRRLIQAMLALCLTWTANAQGGTQQVILTVAGSGASGWGNGGFSGDGGPATSATLNYPESVAVDAAGNLFIADYTNNRIRKVSSGVISTAAGAGPSCPPLQFSSCGGFSGDGGPATSAMIDDAHVVTVDASGNLFIADSDNNRIRKVSTSGIITTVAGSGPFGLIPVGPGCPNAFSCPSGSFSGDGGPAISATINYPESVAVDASGNLYIADNYDNRIRKVSTNGIITTVAGNGNPDFSGDGGPAISASLNFPGGVAVDASGNLFISDTNNFRIRKVSTNGIITTVAGNGKAGFSGDGGPATSASLFGTYGLALDRSGNLFIADAVNNRIRKVSTSGIITTVVGNGNKGFSGDGGPPTSASLSSPVGVAVDASGNLFVADSGNNRIREVQTPSAFSCTYSVSPTSLQAPASGGTLTISVQTAASCPWTVSGPPNWISVLGSPSGTGSATVTFVFAANSGPALTATITVAGISVPVSEAAGSGNATTVPIITEVDNGFSNVPNSPIQSGSWVAIKGNNLSSTNPGRWWNANENFPTSMDGTSVTINGKAAFMGYISQTQVNVQAPTDSTVGPVRVVVTNNGTISAGFTAQYQSSSPAFLQWGGGQYPYALISRGSDLVGDPAVIPNTVAAHAGDTLTLWATGLGATNPPVPAGQDPSTFPPVVPTPAVTVAGNGMAVLGAVLRYGGEYQVNIQLPQSLPTGDLNIQIIQEGFQSPNGVLIHIE